METTQAPPRTESSAPARTELVSRAAKLVPMLQSRAEWTEQNGRLHEEAIEAMAGAGLFKLRTPARYGGYECDTRTLTEVAGQLARGDGSTSWVASVWWITTWMAGLFPDEAQDEVFDTADARVCGTLSPTAKADPVDGGISVTGKWGFISGALHSHWQIVVAMSAAPDGTPMPILALAPMSELTVLDDWHTSGMSGTGSVSTVAQDVFIPRHRVLPLPLVLQEQYGSQTNAKSAIFRTPLLPTASASSVGTLLGLAHAAQENFFERLPGRKITYTDYTEQRAAPLTHQQVAEAALDTAAAEFHAHRLSTLVDDKGAGGDTWTMEERARARADMGRVCQLTKRAVEVLQTASGGSSIYRSVPIQRIERDVRAINMHALMHPDTNLELYGRILCGLDPNTFYI